MEFDIVKTEMSVIFTILLSIHAFASTGYHGPVSSALGGSGRSAIIPGETTLNPAALSFVQGWHATISYRDFTLDPSGKITNLKASLLDSSPENIVPASFSFLKTNDDQEFALGFSKLILGKFSLGMMVNRYIQNPSGGHKEIENDVTIGTIFTLSDNWGVAFVGHNLVRTNIPVLDQTLAFATSYAYKTIARLQLDVLYPTQNNDDGKTVIMGGIESHFVVGFPFRLGYRSDNLRNTRFWTTGLGWIGPRLAIDYAFEKSIKSNKEDAHSVDLRVYF